MKRNWMTVLALTSALLAGPVVAEEQLPTNVTALQIEVLKQQIEVVRATREKREMEAEVIRMRDELRVTTEKASRGAAQSQSLAKQLTDAQRNRVDAEKAQAAAEAETKQANERIQTLQGTVKKLEDDLRKAYREISVQKENVQKQETALTVEKSVSETAVKRANELKQTLAAAQKQLADMQKQLADTQKQLSDTQKGLADAQAVQKQQAEKLAAGETAYGAAVKALADSDKAKAEAEARGEQVKTELEGRIKDLQADAEAKLAEQKQACADLTAKLEAELQAGQQVRAEVERLKARVAELEAPAKPATEAPAQPAPEAPQPAAEAQQPAPAEAAKPEEQKARPTPPPQADLAALLDAIPQPPPLAPAGAANPPPAGSVQITPAK